MPRRATATPHDPAPAIMVAVSSGVAEDAATGRDVVVRRGMRLRADDPLVRRLPTLFEPDGSRAAAMVTTRPEAS